MVDAVSAAAAPSPAPGFAVATFAPAWGAAVMGTAAMAIALQVTGEPTTLAAANTAAARAVYLVAVALGAAVLGITAARWLGHRDAALADLRHPVKGGMTATSAGALLTLAVATGRLGADWLPAGLITTAVAVLAAIGAVLALVIGWHFLSGIISAPDSQLAEVSGAWFIPPVVTIIVPLAVLPLVSEFPEHATTLLVLAWAFLGAGSVLYLVVTATLFARSVGHPLPPAALAPTLIIGMGPAGLIGLDLVRLAQTSIAAGVADPALTAMALPVATMIWGFGLWWLVTALIVLRRGYRALPFTLAWWGFTFPLAAWTIASSALGQAWDSGLLLAIGWAGLAALLVLWTVVAARTLAGLRTGAIWRH